MIDFPLLCVSLEIKSRFKVFEETPTEKPNEWIKFNWSEKIVGLINSAFYIGYVPMIVPMTVVGQKIGFYNFINFALLGNILTTGFFPMITIKFGATGAIGKASNQFR